MRLSDAQLASLAAKGIDLIDSDRFDGVHYYVDGTGVQCHAGRCGKFQINWDRIEDFVSELYELMDTYGPVKDGAILTQDKPKRQKMIITPPEGRTA
jgi:hypothetical protein